MNWNENEFFKLIMTALDRMPADKPFLNDDGSVTFLGRARALWSYALANTGQLNEDMRILEKINLKDSCLTTARKYLPDDAVVSNDFFVVLFGGSSAFSVGRENGFDLLQLPKDAGGAIDVENVIGTFAHEMHHTGFNYCVEQHMADVEGMENLILAGILAAEGMPTYFINKTKENLEKIRQSRDALQEDVAHDWEDHLTRLPTLFVEAEKDIGLNLSSAMGQKEIMEKWMGGRAQGPAYVLGAEMFSVIDTHLGIEAAKPVACDCRRLLSIYNRAAKTANSEGGNLFVFNERLVEKVTNYTGT